MLILAIQPEFPYTAFGKTGGAQELDDEVIDEHIRLYVNDLTLSLVDKGNRAVQTLEDMAKWKKIP